MLKLSKPELRIEVERRRDAVSELLDQIVVEFGGGGHVRQEGPYFRWSDWCEAGEPLDASRASKVTLAGVALGEQVLLKALDREVGEQALHGGGHRVDAALQVRMEQGTPRREHVIGVDRS